MGLSRKTLPLILLVLFFGLPCVQIVLKLVATQ